MYSSFWEFSFLWASVNCLLNKHEITANKWLLKSHPCFAASGRKIVFFRRFWRLENLPLVCYALYKLDHMFCTRCAPIMKDRSTMSAQWKGLCEKTQDGGRKLGSKLSGPLGASCLKRSILRFQQFFVEICLNECWPLIRLGSFSFGTNIKGRNWAQWMGPALNYFSCPPS